MYEGTLQYSLLNGDFFLGASELEVKYDMTRPMLDLVAAKTNPLLPGWVTYMALTGSSPLVIYEVTQAAWAPAGYFNPALLPPPPALPTFRSVATTLYVAGFASSFGIPLYDAAFQVLDPADPTALARVIVRRADGSAIKDYESVGRYLLTTACPGNATKPGFLPSEYDATTTEGHVPRRVVNCSGGTCQ